MKLIVALEERTKIDTFDTTLKIKMRIALYKLETNHRATERHLPYGITQCYMPPDTGERALP